jgi:hypothetical protein
LQEHRFVDLFSAAVSGFPPQPDSVPDRIYSLFLPPALFVARVV